MFDREPESELERPNQTFLSKRRTESSAFAGIGGPPSPEGIQATGIHEALGQGLP